MRTNTKRWQKSRQRRHRRLFNRKQLPLRRALLPLPIRQGPPLEQESPLKAEIHKKIKKLTKEELILPKKRKMTIVDPTGGLASSTMTTTITSITRSKPRLKIRWRHRLQSKRRRPANTLPGDKEKRIRGLRLSVMLIPHSTTSCD